MFVVKNKITVFVSCFLLLISCFLPWCAKVAVNQSGSGELQQFVMQVAPVASFGAKGGFKKSGIVATAEQVTVSAQLAWRVVTVQWKIGQQVNLWQQILALQDTAGNVSFASKRAAIGLEAARDSYNQQALNLDKTLFDTQLSFQRNQVSSENTKTDVSKQQEKIQKDLQDNDLTVSGSNLSLQLEKLGNDLEKAELDYQARLSSDNQTIQNFFNTVKLIGTDLNNLFADVVEASDNLLGYTPEKRYINDGFEAVLGNKDFSTKTRAEDAFGKMLASYNEFKTLSNDVDTGTIVALLKSYQAWVDSMNTELTSINTLLINTQPDWSALPATQYNILKGQFDGYKSKASGLGSSITNQVNGISSFFATYQQSQESLAKGIDSLKQQIELSKKWLSDTEFNTKLNADRQLLGLDTTVKNQEIADRSNEYTADFVVKSNQAILESLWNSISNAQVSYEEANFAREKLNVKSPILWTITDVLVDKGQEVGPGTPLFTIVNTDLTQIELDITAWEKQLLTPGQQVILNQEWVEGIGIVESVSDVADRNFGYKVVVVITQWEFDIWSSVEVEFAGSLGDTIVVPLNAVTIVDNGRGVIQLWKWGQIVPTAVDLWALAWEYVIVTNGLDNDSLIITSDTSNYDPQKMEARIKASTD